MKETNIAFSTQFKTIQYDFSGEKISSDGGLLKVWNISVLLDLLNIRP